MKKTMAISFISVKKMLWRLVRILILLVPAFLMLAPVVLLLSGSIMSRQELAVNLKPILEGGSGYISWKLIPDYPTLEHYGKLLFLTPQFFIVFWNSVKLVVCILAGQLIIGVPAAWAFAVFRFKGKNILFTLYVILMLMPFQVTMLSQYLVLNSLNMFNTHWAIILPAVFSTFPVFLVYRGFSSLPKGLLEAGRIDGAGEWYLFFKIGVPLSSGGIRDHVDSGCFCIPSRKGLSGTGDCSGCAEGMMMRWSTGLPGPNENPIQGIKD